MSEIEREIHRESRGEIYIKKRERGGGGRVGERAREKRERKRESSSQGQRE